MELNEFQQRASTTDRHVSTDPVEFYLVSLVGEAGQLATALKRRIRDRTAYSEFAARIAAGLGDVLWYVAAVASELGLDLEQVALATVARNEARWLSQPTAPLVLDADAPSDQRLPRRFSITFASDEDGVRIYDEHGNQVGNRLTDNAYDTDFYRYHDVFHLAYAAVLGWSPTTRSMLALKRKYDDKVDEVEDGARAIFTEEAVSAAMFKLAEGRNFYESAIQVGSDELDLVRKIVAGLEVSVRSASEWESAILQGFDAWRGLVQHGGGSVTCDLDVGLLTFEPSGAGRGRLEN